MKTTLTKSLKQPSVSRTFVNQAIPSSQFSWKNGNGVTFITDVQSYFYGRYFNPIYNDAADCGFAIKSKKTGVVVGYNFEGELISRDNEISGWTFKSMEPSIKSTIKIFND